MVITAVYQDGNMFIYKITNIINNKVYIGQTNNWSKRKSAHLLALRSNKHQNKHMQRSFNIHKENNFSFEIIENNIICPIVIDYKERLYIKQYNSTVDKYGYNKESGGSLNKKISEEARKKMSIAATGRKCPSITKIKLSLARKGKKPNNYGIPRSESAKLKASKTMKGRPAHNKGKKVSIETLLRMSEAQLKWRKYGN